MRALLTHLRTAVALALALGLAARPAQAVAFIDADDPTGIAANPAARVSSFVQDFVYDGPGDIEYVTSAGSALVAPGAFGLSYAIAAGFLGGNATFAAAVASAFATWSQVGSAVAFFNVGQPPIADTETAFFGANVDVFSAPGNDPRFGGPGVLAFAQPLFTLAGKIISVDIIFNESFAWGTAGAAGTFDVQSVALHEIGHTLGFNHPDQADDLGRNFAGGSLPSLVPISATGSEVMFSTFGPGEVRRTPTADEVAGLRFLDPLPASPVPEPGTVALLGVAGFLALRRRRAR
jgi:hypothetical protein